jgi:hypothetical protein
VGESQDPEPRVAPRDRRQTAIERLREIRERNVLAADAPLAEELVREDRDS